LKSLAQQNQKPPADQSISKLIDKMKNPAVYIPGVEFGDRDYGENKCTTCVPLVEVIINSDCTYK
jgi:hypothetical protein